MDEAALRLNTADKIASDPAEFRHLGDSYEAHAERDG